MTLISGLGVIQGHWKWRGQHSGGRRVLTTGSERSHSVDRRIRVILEHIFVHLKPDIFPRGGGVWGMIWIWMRQQNQRCQLLYIFFAISCFVFGFRDMTHGTDNGPTTDGLTSATKACISGLRRAIIAKTRKVGCTKDLLSLMKF